MSPHVPSSGLLRLVAYGKLTARRDTPALQESSWGNYVAELLNPVTPHGADGEYADYCPVDESLFFTQRQIDQWAAENFPSLTTSISSSPDQEGEQICYGMVRPPLPARRGLIDII